jgi:hypothetical protein
LENQNRRLALVRPNNPPPGVAGFLFDVVDDDGSELESDITDHYIEDNTAIQDHIALRPETVTVTGRVAELVKSVPVTKPITQVTNPLPLVPDLMPTLAPGSQEREDAEVLAQTEGDAVIQFAQDLYGFYQNNSRQQPAQTKQSYIYGYIYQLWKGRQLFSVETPWGIFENMAILTASAKQGPESRSVSEFTITFKKIRVARTINVLPGLLEQRAVFDQNNSGNLDFLAGRSAFQRSPQVENGIVGQTPFTDAQSLQFNYQINPTR